VPGEKEELEREILNPEGHKPKKYSPSGGQSVVTKEKFFGGKKNTIQRGSQTHRDPTPSMICKKKMPKRHTAQMMKTKIFVGVRTGKLGGVQATAKKDDR